MNGNGNGKEKKALASSCMSTDVSVFVGRLVGIGCLLSFFAVFCSLYDI
jgi:hypothetical protein